MKPKLILLCSCLVFPLTCWADTITFEASHFTLNPTFSNVQAFQITIVLAAPLVPGTVYSNPALISVDYQVSGLLNGTPSGFPAFALVRSIGGDEFYSQGSSISFEIDAGADLSDGLQVSELAGAGLVFEFNARELGTGRYHPPLFQLNADGTGSIRNSNNQGGVNPVTQQEVNVDFGDEYITELGFDPAVLNLLAPKPDEIHSDGFESG
jgi:hypothetical protein